MKTTLPRLRLTSEVKNNLPVLKRELEQHGYTHENLARVVGRHEGNERALLPVEFAERIFPSSLLPRPIGLPVSQLSKWLPASTSDGPLDQLIRLFHIGQPLALGRLKGLFSAAALGALFDSGILRQEGEVAIANLFVNPWLGFIFVSDPIDNETHPDFVINPNQSSALTFPFMFPRPEEPCGTALDIGTGSGALAIVASLCYGKVTGTDINERAIEFARFNAALNGRENVTFELKDVLTEGFDPVDLVVFNFPALYCEYVSRAVACSVEDSDRLLTSAYQTAAQILSPQGRAVLRHDIRSLEHYQEALKQIAGLRVIWSDSGSQFGTVRSGIANVERAPGASSSFVRVPAIPSMNRAEVLGRYLPSVKAWAQNAAAAKIPGLYSHIEIRTNLNANESGFVEGEQIEFVDRLFRAPLFQAPAMALKVLRQCDGTKTIGQIASENAVVLKTLRSLTEAGVIFLK